MKITAKLKNIALVKNSTCLRVILETNDSQKLIFYTHEKLPIDISTLSTTEYVKATFKLLDNVTEARKQRQLLLQNIEPTTEKEFTEATNIYVLKGWINKLSNIYRNPVTTYPIKTTTGEFAIILDPKNVVDYLQPRKIYEFITVLEEGPIYNKKGERQVRQQVYFKLVDTKDTLPHKKETNEDSDYLLKYFGLPTISEEEKLENKEIEKLFRNKKYF